MRKHKVLTFLLSLLVAVGLWVYAVTVVNPDDTLEISDIRVRVTGTSSLAADGLMLTSSDVQYVDVEIAGRRSDLKELNSSTLEAVANVSNIDKAGTYEVSWTLNPPATVASGDISLVSASSNRITVQVSERWEREIPLEVEYIGGEPAEGYLRGEVFTEEEYIAVSGPAEEVGKIDRAVVSIDLTNADSKIDDDFAYCLLDENGEELTMSDFVTLSSETAHITVQILPYKDISLQVNLISGAGLTAEDVTVSFSPQDTVRVTGSEEALVGVEDTIVFDADLAEIDGVNYKNKLTLSESYPLPGGVTVWDEGASRIEVEIHLKVDDEIVTKDIRLGSFENLKLVIDHPEGNMQYSLAENDLDTKILLRGKEDALEALIKEAKITCTAYMDEPDPSTGMYRMTLTITLPDVYDTVTVLGEYYISLDAVAVELPE